MNHQLERRLFLPLPRSDVFPFFADAANLERITPRELRFRISSPLPIVMREGAEIRYRLRLFGVPFRWLTNITTWQPEQCFVDEQVRGPFALWKHRHEFHEVPGGCEIRDRVDYSLPFSPIGDLVHPIVRRQLDRIFDHRQRATQAFFGVAGRELAA